MTNLRHTKVYRGGITTSRRDLETSDCGFAVDEVRGSLDFHFTLASKGGGRTGVILELGAGDLDALLCEIGLRIPGGLQLLISAAAEAVREFRSLADLRSVVAGSIDSLEAAHLSLLNAYALDEVDSEGVTTAHKAVQETLDKLRALKAVERQRDE